MIFLYEILKYKYFLFFKINTEESTRLDLITMYIRELGYKNEKYFEGLNS